MFKKFLEITGVAALVSAGIAVIAGIIAGAKGRLKLCPAADAADADAADETAGTAE